MDEKDWDIFMYGNHYEDEQGNRIDPATVEYVLDGDTVVGIKVGDKIYKVRNTNTPPAPPQPQQEEAHNDRA